jgi:excisionase family DNA binding protein
MLSKLAYQKVEAAAVLSIGLTKLDQLIADGTIRAVKSGKITLVPTTELEKYLKNLPVATLREHSNMPADKARRAAARAREEA